MRTEASSGWHLGVFGDDRCDEYLDGGVGVFPELINGEYGFEGLYGVS